MVEAPDERASCLLLLPSAYDLAAHILPISISCYLWQICEGPCKMTSQTDRSSLPAVCHFWLIAASTSWSVKRFSSSLTFASGDLPSAMLGPNRLLIVQPVEPVC